MNLRPLLLAFLAVTTARAELTEEQKEFRSKPIRMMRSSRRSCCSRAA